MKPFETGTETGPWTQVALRPHLEDSPITRSPIVPDRITQTSHCADADESLVVDVRWGMSPAQMVEDKLSRMLQDGSMPVSHLQMRKLVRPR
jgi:hypothetical protein